MGKYSYSTRNRKGVMDVSETETQSYRSGGKNVAKAATDGSCYLELRSRRLHKPMHHSASSSAKQHCFSPASTSSSFSFGQNDNFLDSLPTETRNTGESSPCSLIRVSTLDLTTKQKCSGAAVATQRLQNAFPSAYDLDQFFALEEEPFQHRFTEKYNYDFVNDVPLAGRYEWEAVKTVS